MWSSVLRGECWAGQENWTLDTDDKCKPLQTLFWKNSHGEYRNTGETRHGQINSRKRPSPWALGAGLTPGGAVGTGIFSLSVGFKKSKIEQELMIGKEAAVREDIPSPFKNRVADVLR